MLKHLLIGLTAIVICLFLILLLLMSTETGTRWIIQTTLSQQQQIKVIDIQGTLISRLSLSGLQFQDDNNFRVRIASLNLQWNAAELFKGRLHIKRFQLDDVKVNGQPVIEESSKNNAGMPSIPVSIIINQLKINQFQWHKAENKNNLTIQQLELTAKVENQILTVSGLSMVMSRLTLQANSEISLQSNRPITANLDWVYESDDAQLQGRLFISGDSKRLELDSYVKGDIESTLNGFVALSGKQSTFRLKGQLQKLQWPIQGVSQMSSRQGEFILDGSLQRYHVSIAAEVMATNQRKYDVSFVANGNQQSMAIERFLLKPKQGQLNLDGQISWHQGVHFNLALQGSQLNPMDLGGEIAAQLELQSVCKGQWLEDKVNAELTIENLSGYIYDQPLHAVGKIKIVNKQLNFEQFDVHAGRNHLTVKGQLNEQQTNLEIVIVANDLQTAWPTVAGKLNGDIVVKGSVSKPVITGYLKGQELVFAEYKVGFFSLNTNYLHASSEKSKVDFSANNIRLAEQQIDRIIFRGQGNQNNHELNLELHSSLADFKINTKGQWNGKQWLGHISQLDIDHPQFEQWQLQYPTEIAFTNTKKSYLFELKNSCLTQQDARLCITAKRSSEGQINGQLIVSSLPLAIAKQWLPEQLTLAGTLSAQAQLTKVNKNIVAELNADIANGLAIVTVEKGMEEIPFTTPFIRLKYKNDQLNSHVNIELGNQDFVTADIDVGKAGLRAVRQLAGSVQAKITHMSWIDSLISEVSQLQGLLVADLKLKGDTQQPILDGSVQWQKGQFEIEGLANTFQNINIKLNSIKGTPQRLQIEAKAESGEGNLSVKGHLDLLAKHDYPLQINVKGEKFLLSRLPEAEIIVSPILKINKNDEQTQIDGLVKIDSAKVEIKTVPEGAITPSDDEIIIVEKQTNPIEKKLSPLNVDVAIDLGEKLHFSGFGLDTFLTGQLQYSAKEGQQAMHGRVEMNNASYRSYGQDLTLRKGEFLFNGPVDNPALLLEAFREAINDEVTAILRVTGTLKSPETQVFTEPTLPESEALSYLVTGKSINQIGDNEGGSLANAAFNYGAGQLSWLSDQLGVDEFEFQEGKTIQEGAVKIGHSISPKLQIGVTMGLFSSSYTANLRYQINKYFSIGTRAGETQRIDLKYHIEVE